ncbi:MAG: effector binding domain-containing protein [Cytophagaceae bacterium]|nr:effector binding domain-containing protein [Cytophagaceae bacterium]
MRTYLEHIASCYMSYWNICTRDPAIEKKIYEIKIFEEVWNPENWNQEFNLWIAGPLKFNASIPEELEAFTLPGGLFAKFPYQGSLEENGIYHYIYTRWLPESIYEIGLGPQYEIAEYEAFSEPNRKQVSIYIPLQLRQ